MARVGLASALCGHRCEKQRQAMSPAAEATEGEQPIDRRARKGRDSAGELDVARRIRIAAFEDGVEHLLASPLIDPSEECLEQPDSGTVADLDRRRSGPVGGRGYTEAK